MKLAKDYNSVMGRSAEIMKASLGLDFNDFESGSVAFDYEGLMKATGYTIEEVDKIQSKTGVGHTQLLELRNITKLARKYAKPGYGARIFVKDEAANASGSFKDRRAACAVAHAKKLGYKGVIAATSGNYGAAVASQAAMQGMKCIIVQECYDSHGVGQPEIVEKARKCEALGAEVIQLTVGPELFYEHLSVMEDSGYFNASLYSPFGIAGVETLGYEIAIDCREKLAQNPQSIFLKKTVLEDLYSVIGGKKEKLSSEYQIHMKKEKAIEGIVSLTRLEGLLDRHPYDLSGGEQQRLALAKVLLLRPRILLMDEPTKGMDAEYKEEIWKILCKLKQHGMTIFMISHDVEFVAEYADRVGLFFEGNVVTSQNTREFFAGNNFYTTAANRMARQMFPDAVIGKDVITCLQKSN